MRRMWRVSSSESLTRGIAVVGLSVWECGSSATSQQRKWKLVQCSVYWTPHICIDDCWNLQWVSMKTRGMSLNERCMYTSHWGFIVFLLMHEGLIGWEMKGRGLRWRGGNLEPRHMGSNYGENIFTMSESFRERRLIMLWWFYFRTATGARFWYELLSWWGMFY